MEYSMVVYRILKTDVASKDGNCFLPMYSYAVILDDRQKPRQEWFIYIVIPRSA